jgi:hypothetical protein
MPDIVKKSGWNRQFKSHGKTQKRLMTEAEAVERDANSRERAAVQEARLQDTLIPSSLPSASTKIKMVPNTPS